MAINKKILLLLALLCLLASCKMRRIPSVSVYDEPSSSFYCVPYQSITVKKAKISYVADKQQMSGMASFYIRRDSLFFFTLSAMGMEAARGSLSSDSFKMINRLEKSYYSLPSSGFVSFLGVPLSPGLLNTFFYGRTCSSWLEDVGYVCEKQSAKQSLYSYNNAVSLELITSGKGDFLTELVFKNHEDNRVCKIFYDSFDVYNDIILPSSFVITVTDGFEKELLRLKIQMQEVSFNENRTILLSKPKSYEEKTI